MGRKIASLVKTTDSRKRIECPALDTTYQALSAEAKTKQGKGVIVHVADELGEIEGPESELFNNVESGMVGQRNPLTIIVSTQAAADEDLLSRLIDAQQSNPRGDTVLHLYSADEDSELSDPAAHARANPALGIIAQPAELERNAEMAELFPERAENFRRYHLNLRSGAGATRWLSRGAWQMGAAAPGEIDFERPIYGGLDLSETTDLTTLVWAQEKDDGSIAFWPRVWMPSEGLRAREQADRVPYSVWVDEGLVELTGGTVVDYRTVAAAIVTMRAAAGRRMRGVGYDSWRFSSLAHGFDWGEAKMNRIFHPIGQGFVKINPAIELFERGLAQGKIRHGSHPLLTMAADRAVIRRSPDGLRKIDKSLARHRIDPLMAALFALDTLENLRRTRRDLYQGREMAEA